MASGGEDGDGKTDGGADDFAVTRALIGTALEADEGDGEIVHCREDWSGCCWGYGRRRMGVAFVG